MTDAPVTIGIGPWDIGLGHLARVVVSLLVAVAGTAHGGALTPSLAVDGDAAPG